MTTTQAFGTVKPVRIGLGENARAASSASLNQILADTMTLRDLYKKHHWQVSGETFYQLHLLFDMHHGEQVDLMDALAERVQTLGGVALAMSRDVAEATRIERAPKDREGVADQLRRLLAAHELVLTEARQAAREAADNGDDGTNDLLVSEVVRKNEAQSWMVAEHLEGMGGVA